MKVLRKKCQYCGKEITSLYEAQLDYNLNAHEIACSENPKNIKIKENKEEKK